MTQSALAVLLLLKPVHCALRDDALVAKYHLPVSGETNDPFVTGGGLLASGVDFAAAFGRPVKVVNDAAMQALGSYCGGKLLFLGLGTGLGSTMIVDGIVEPMELGHLPYRDGTFEQYVGLHGLETHGLAQWRRDVEDVVARLIAALEPTDVVLGGGNVHQLETLPPGCRAGDNSNAFVGGERLWKRSPVKRRAAGALTAEAHSAKR